MQNNKQNCNTNIKGHQIQNKQNLEEQIKVLKTEHEEKVLTNLCLSLIRNMLNNLIDFR